MKAIVFPGQGSQRIGMGSDLFEQFPELVAAANAVLGYSITDLCLNSAGGKLDKTAFTQPAIYVVSMMRYYAMTARAAPPNFAAGHSVGEYAALAAAEVFDFVTGLRLVQQRGLHMSEAFGGGLVAILGLDAKGVEQLLSESEITELEIANINSPAQVVVGGRKDRLQDLIEACTTRSIRAVPLRVSGAFHTTHMARAAAKFADFLHDIEFLRPRFPVISNVTAREHETSQIRERLARHMVKPVLWAQSIETMLDAGVTEFAEAGTPPILAPLIFEIRRHYRNNSPGGAAARNPALPITQRPRAAAASFCETFNCSPAIAGSLGHGIAGPKLVRALAKSGVLSFLDTEGLEIEAIDDALAELSADATTRGRFGLSLRADPNNPGADERLVDLALRHGIRCIEAKGYHEPSHALLRYRAKGDPTVGGARTNRVIAHVNSLETATTFILSSTDLSDSGAAPRLPAITTKPWADALCIDLHAWRTRYPASQAVLQTVLAWRDAYRSEGHLTPFYVGVAGVSCGPEYVKAELATSIDFVSAGALYLMAHEASVDPELLRAVRINAGSHMDVPDWHFPELGSRSWSFVRDVKLAEAAERLQSLYGDPAASAQGVETVALDLPEPFATRLRDLAASLGGALAPIDFRKRLRPGLKTLFYPGIIACDTSTTLFLRSMQQAHSVNDQTFHAACLAEHLYPAASDIENKTEKQHA